MKTYDSHHHKHHSSSSKSSSKTHSTLASEKDRRKYSSAFSSRSSSSSSSLNEGGSQRRMKLIIIMGIALPVVAAVIGVVAWAVSAADSVHPLPLSSSLRRSDHAVYDDSYIDVLAHQSDLVSSSNNIHHSYSKQESPSTRDTNDHYSADEDGVDLLSQLSASTPKEGDDPLYIVHFVPSPKPKIDDSSSASEKTASEKNDILDKILSTTKGTKPGTPQFVVFAPVPDEEDTKSPNSQEDRTPKDSTPLSPPRNDEQFDYVYIDDASKQRQKSDLHDILSRSGGLSHSSPTIDKSTGVFRTGFHTTTHNVTTGGAYVGNQNGMPVTHYGGPVQIQIDNSPQRPQVSYQNTYTQPRQKQGFIDVQGLQQALASQTVPARQFVQQPVHSHQQASVPQQYRSHAQQQQYAPPEQHPHLARDRYQQQHTHQQPPATDRSGQYAPLGLSLSFGNSGHNSGYKGGLSLGGGHSPLGIIGAILKPLLPRAQANLNGKVMFGVMLENGIKFGGQKKFPHQPSYYG